MFATLQPFALSLLRIVLGITFTQHGVQKLFGWLGGLGGAAAAPGSLMWSAGVLETFGGLLILLGLFTRPVAFLLAGQMAVAYFMQHAPQGFWTLKNGGELSVMYCFAYLFFVTAGPGPWSVDRVLLKKD